MLERPYGEGGEATRRGTKHFRAGAKVVCVRFLWGGDETMAVLVVGRHRASSCYIRISERGQRLTNWRLELVYSPRIIELVRDYAAESDRQLEQIFDAETIANYRRWRAQEPLSFSDYPLDGSAQAKNLAEEILANIPNSLRAQTQPPTSTR